MRASADLILHNIGQLLTMDPADERLGDSERDPVAGLGLVLDAAIAIAGGRVVWVGRERDLEAHVDRDGANRIDLGGAVALPGLVDCHTHAVFAGSRAQEFARRVGGATYEQILAEGGGIHSTVRATRKASIDQLVAATEQRLDHFLEAGVTTVEIKSGYGLDLETELKILRAVARLSHTVGVVPTFLGAHVVPKEKAHDRRQYVDLIVEEMIPRVAEESLARFCDVYLEHSAFNLEEARRILEAGLAHGLRPKIHGEQLSHTGAVGLAVEVGAVSIDHLEFADREDARKLAASSTIAVLLPGATYFLGKTRFADGRMLADEGCRIAVSTDLNPGSCNTENLPLMLNMACLFNRLYPREVLLGATRWAAEALGLEGEVGALIPGSQADVLVLDLFDYRNLIYHFGVNHTAKVYKRGQLVFEKVDGRVCSST